MKIDPSICRLCFTHADEPIDIFGAASAEFNIVDVLAQYFRDQVTQDEVLPKVMCYDCWSQIETFHSFVQRIIAIREDYLRQPLNDCAKFGEEEEYENEPDEVAVSMDEIEIHQENVCLDPISMINGDLLKGEIKLMDTKYQIDMEIEENEAIFKNREECNDILCDTDQSTSTTKPMARIEIDTGAKSTKNRLESRKPKPKYICEICNEAFRLKLHIKKHLSTHFRYKPKCTICKERFESQEILEQHLKSSHFEGLDDYAKEIKEMVLNVSEEQMKQAMDNHIKKTCDLCTTEFNSFSDARNHYSKLHNTLRYLKCCNMQLRSHNEFSDHVYWHFNPTVFVCRFCQKDLKCRTVLLYHLKSHKALDTKKFACNACNKIFGTKNTLETHVNYYCQLQKVNGARRLPSDDQSTEQQTPDEILVNESTSDEFNEDTAIAECFDMTCDLCPFLFESFRNAQSHYLDVHRMENGYLKCCQTKFKTMQLIKDHIAWHKDPNVFRCQECDKPFRNRYSLFLHKKIHLRNFVCNICAKTYPFEKDLTKHMRTHEKRERSFICDVCNKGFYDKKHLYYHKTRHQLKTKHICEFCGKGFVSQQELKSHAKTHDQNVIEIDRQFQCNICEKWFKTKYNLSAHMIRHSSGPQKCDQCDKIAPNITALDTHIRTVHCESKFECHLCDKKFKRKPALKDHIATHKGERNYKCTFCDETFVWRMNMYAHRKIMHRELWMAEKIRTNAKQLKP